MSSEPMTLEEWGSLLSELSGPSFKAAMDAVERALAEQQAAEAALQVLAEWTRSLGVMTMWCPPGHKPGNDGDCYTSCIDCYQAAAKAEAQRREGEKS